MQLEAAKQGLWHVVAVRRYKCDKNWKLVIQG